MGLAVLCNFQFASFQPADPCGLSVVCAESVLRIAFMQIAATMIQGSVLPSKPAILAHFGCQTLNLCRFSRGTLLKTA